MHKANLILGEPNAVALQEVVDEYNLSIAEDKGVRKPGTIGSYTSAYRIIKAKGIAAYPERVELSLALYLQDYLVSLGEPKQFNEKGKKIS